MGEWLHGWEEFAPKYEAMITSGVKFILYKNELSINVDKNGEIAWGTADVIFQIKGSNEKKHHMWETVVFEKIDGEWKIVQALAAPALNVKEE